LIGTAWVIFYNLFDWYKKWYFFLFSCYSRPVFLFGNQIRCFSFFSTFFINGRESIKKEYVFWSYWILKINLDTSLDNTLTKRIFGKFNFLNSQKNKNQSWGILTKFFNYNISSIQFSKSSNKCGIWKQQNKKKDSNIIKILLTHMQKLFLMKKKSKIWHDLRRFGKIMRNRKRIWRINTWYLSWNQAHKYSLFLLLFWSIRQLSLLLRRFAIAADFLPSFFVYFEDFAFNPANTKRVLFKLLLKELYVIRQLANYFFLILDLCFLIIQLTYENLLVG